MSDLRRIWGKARAGIRRRFLESPPTWGRLGKAALLAFGLITVGVAPLMLNGTCSWSKFGDWCKAVAVAWPAILGAFVLKLLADLRQRREWDSREKGRRKRISFWLAEVVSDLFSSGRKSQPNVRRMREHLLRTIVVEVAAVLNEQAEHRIVASLVALSSDNDDDMKVVARSQDDRPLTTYHKEELVSWESISKHRPIMVDDVSADGRFSRVSKPYRCIAAIPVVRQGLAYAGVVIDHPDAYAFMGRLRDIEIRVQPMVRLIALTFEDDAPSLPSHYNPADVTIQQR